MEMDRGKLAVLAIVIGIIVQGFGGFMQNARTVTSCQSEFTYQTDVYGQFQGSGQDIPVDFNPRENITGYYAQDPLDPNQNPFAIKSPAIVYDPTKDGVPNNYPYQQQNAVTTTYTVTVECTKDPTSTDYESYILTITKYTESGTTTNVVEYTSEKDLTKYSGLYDKRTVGLDDSKIWDAYGNEHKAPRIMNISEFRTQADIGQDLYISVADASGYYPMFLAGLSGSKSQGVWDYTYNYSYTSLTQGYAYAYSGDATCEIHNVKYPIQDSWLVFGDENGHNTITLDILQTSYDESSRYINPNNGVAPSHQSGEYTEFYDEFCYPAAISANFDIDDNYVLVGGMGTQQFTHTLAFQIGFMKEEVQENPEIIYRDAAYIELHGYKVGDTQAGQTITFIDPSSGDRTTATMSSPREQLYFGMEWNVDHGKITLRVHGGGADVSAEYHFDWLAGEFMACRIITQGEETHTQYAYAQLDLTLSDTYVSHIADQVTWSGDTKSKLNPDDPGSYPNQGHFYYVDHKSRTVHFESDQTYWNNGYNNSVIGMVVACTPVIDQEGREVPAETKFNMLLHMNDSTVDTKYTDRWIYGDALKPVITIFTDPNTGMVYIGHYNEDGILDTEHCMQIGACEHAYIEFRVENGKLKVYVSPLYTFRDFMNYELSTLTDQTSALAGMIGFGQNVQSIGEIAYKTNVDNDAAALSVSAQYGRASNETMRWVSGDCTVALDTETGVLTVSGNGAMANYTSYDRAPWWTERNYIKSVLISDGVTKIGNFAFNGCIVMNAVTIEDSVTAIGYNAFGSCWALTSVTLPRSVLTIENDTFAGCSRLTTISVDAANPNYADIDGVLFNKAKTTLILYPGAHGASYTIPNSVKIIGDSAFEYSSIVSVIIPDSVKEIGVSAFQDCYSLSSVVIGSKVANIADYAFYGCYAIKTIVIMATAWNTGLGQSAFDLGITEPAYADVYSPNNSAYGRLDPQAGADTSFTYLILPYWVSGDCTCILTNGLFLVSGDGRMADYRSASQTPWFSYLSQIGQIQIDRGVTYIGAYAFQNSSAESVSISDTVTEIGERQFADSYADHVTITFQTEGWNITAIGEEAFQMGRSQDHTVVCDIYSHLNIAQGKLNGYSNIYTTLDYHSIETIYPAYPRQLVTKTVILLDGGGLYVQDGELSLNAQFPNDVLSEFVINSVVHPGDSLSLVSGGQSKAILTTDGVDKWNYNGKLYDWWDVEIYYVAYGIPDTQIDGHDYEGQMYLPDGTELMMNHVYVKAGKYGSYDDIFQGGLDTDTEGHSLLTIRMDGIWAFSTQYYKGENVQGSHITFDEPGKWGWSWNELLVVFGLVMLAGAVILFYKYGFNLWDILMLGGQLALIWVSFQM